jgi:phosphoribosylaminoimidazole carboxylase PurE protein
LAAHLAGALVAQTTLPVIGVPLSAGTLGGFDSLLSTVQMPPGLPVATVAIGGAANAGLLAASILALGNAELKQKLKARRAQMRDKVLAADARVRGA